MAKKSNFEIAFELGAKMDPSMKKTFSDAQKRIGNFAGSVGKAVKTGAKVAAGMGAAFVGIGSAAFAMTKKVTASFDAISKGAQRVGVSSDFYQEMDFWASQNGLSHENMEKAIGRLNQRVGMAADGNKKYADALTDLGVNMDDVKNGTVSTEEVMAQSIQSLSEMTNGNKQAALASDLFGTKLGRELLPSLQEGALSIEDAKKKAEELGIVIGEDSLNAGVKFQDTWDQMKRSMTTAGQQIIAKLIPKFQKMLDWVIENMPAIQNKISNALSMAGDIAEKAGDLLASGLEKAQPIIDWIGNTGIPMARDAIQTIVEKAKEFYQFISKNWSTIKPLLIGLGTALVIVKGSMIALSVVQVVTGFLKGFKAATIAGRLAMLGLNGAMLANPAFWIIAAFMAVIAIGIAVWKNWDTVKTYLLIAWEAIKAAVSTVGTAISNAFTSAYNWVIGLFTGIGEWFTGIFTSVQNTATTAGTWISDNFTAAYNAITGLFSGLGDWFTGIWSGVTGVFTGGINSIIGLANSAIDKLNGISVDIPDWVPNVGGSTFGLSIPNIPYLASGGITTGPTLAMIGEGAEQEAVLPLSKLQALLDSPGSTDSNNNLTLQYNPQVIVQGNADKEDVQRALNEDRKKFEKWIEEYLYKKRRVSL
ncbi:hypothetical protein [Gracilibacillus xinjiangensis]|uniref:Phage tail tape measure protein n=1 Tax=Gracilibacillus xinjiangensis TaxID=1193282 RepID=A0ABV8WVM3_9BACI